MLENYSRPTVRSRWTMRVREPTAKGYRILGHPCGETAFGGDTTGLIVDVDRIVGSVALAEGAPPGWAFSGQEF